MLDLKSASGYIMKKNKFGGYIYENFSCILLISRQYKEHC